MAKGVGILWLLLYHLFSNAADLESMGVSYRPFTESGFVMLAGFGKICVAVFVFLSSYGIAKGLFEHETDLKEAYRQAYRRLFKLMGGFFALYLSVCIVFFPWLDFGEVYGYTPQGILFWITDALGLANVFGTPTLNDTWWYMEIAYGLIIFVPVLAALTKKIGYGILGIGFFIPVILSDNYNIHVCFLTVCVGIAAAYGDWFAKLDGLKWPVGFKWLAGVVGTVLLVFIRGNFAVREYYIFVIEAAAAFFIIWTTEALFSAVPVLREVLYFIGKHSLNIFLVHSFFYLMIFRDYVFSFTPAIVTFLILLAVSLLYSVILEAIKKFIVKGYQRIGKTK